MAPFGQSRGTFFFAKEIAPLNRLRARIKSNASGAVQLHTLSLNEEWIGVSAAVDSCSILGPVLCVGVGPGVRRASRPDESVQPGDPERCWCRTRPQVSRQRYPYLSVRTCGHSQWQAVSRRRPSGRRGNPLDRCWSCPDTYGIAGAYGPPGIQRRPGPVIRPDRPGLA